MASPSSVASRAQKAPPDFGRALASDRSAHDDAIIPIEIAFLEDYGVDRRTLRQACEIAERHGVSPEAALLDEGMIGEEQFYLALADLLRTPYYAGEPPVDPAADPRFAISSGFVALRGNASGLRAAVAPRGEALRFLLEGAAQRRKAPAIAICSRQRLSALIRAQSGERVAWAASNELRERDPSLTACSGPTPAQWAVAGCGAFALAALAAQSPETARTLISFGLWLVFAGALWLRTFAVVAAQAPAPVPMPAEPELPVYTIVVALYREARVVGKLVAALDAIDYPRAKLDIKLVLERRDRETLAALAAMRLPARYDVIVAPPGAPLTKPRALNVALSAARGTLLVVYDAEDAPAPDQLRLAAARFAAEPGLDCLQARLVIHNAGDSWLSAAFAVEYAALFDILNPGLAALGAPMALGGSSNHFRVATLRRVCGWDAWNVTEGADLGIRLARFGAQVGVLSSDTYEEAPHEFGNWFRQRVRWQKGWMHTLIVHSRRPLRLCRELGAGRTVAAGLLIAGAWLGGLFGPYLLLETATRPFAQIGSPRGPLSHAGDVATYILVLWGVQTVVVPALVAMARRRMNGVCGVLLRMPLYYGLISLATWAAMFDLAVRPFHWSKTEHGRARAETGSPAPAAPSR